MHTSGSRELKNRLGRYLDMVRRGKSLLVTDRGKPIAKLTPADEASPDESSLDAILKNLEEHQLIRRAKGPLRKFRPVKATGKSASEIILADRR